jgi:hypothetical protein
VGPQSGHILVGDPSRRVVALVGDGAGVRSERVKSLSDLTHAVKAGLSSDRPSLVEISQRRIGDS